MSDTQGSGDSRIKHLCKWNAMNFKNEHVNTSTLFGYHMMVTLEWRQTPTFMLDVELIYNKLTREDVVYCCLSMFQLHSICELIRDWL